MPLIIKHGGALADISREQTFLRYSGQVVSPESGFVKQNDVWYPIWTPDGDGEPGGNSPLPAGVPRWGVAQFSDTDFTGGKTDPNMDGQPYERWSGVQDFMDSVLHTHDPSLFVDLDITFPNYGYFAHKASEGTASFLDSVNGWPGGWDGAKWEDGGFGSETGPLIVTYDDGSGPAEWKIYRTDFSGIGKMAWQVTIS